MRLLASIAFAACLLSSVTEAQVDEDGVETVLVTGEQPGPSLWEVTDGVHSLWLLASYAPLPSGLQWKADEVDAIIAQAQEVIGPYQASFRVADSDTLRAKKSRLKRVLPRKEYARWRALKKKYIGDIQALAELAASDQEYAALNAHSWPFLQGDKLQAAIALTDERWVEAAHAALKRNVTTFAVLPAYLVFQEDGPLAALEAHGYVILEPERD